MPTPEEKEHKTCPFLSIAASGAHVPCLRERCQLWWFCQGKWVLGLADAMKDQAQPVQRARVRLHSGLVG